MSLTVSEKYNFKLFFLFHILFQIFIWNFEGNLKKSFLFSGNHRDLIKLTPPHCNRTTSSLSSYPLQRLGEEGHSRTQRGFLSTELEIRLYLSSLNSSNRCHRLSLEGHFARGLHGSPMMGCFPSRVFFSFSKNVVKAKKTLNRQAKGLFYMIWLLSISRYLHRYDFHDFPGGFSSFFSGKENVQTFFPLLLLPAVSQSVWAGVWWVALDLLLCGKRSAPA